MAYGHRCAPPQAATNPLLVMSKGNMLLGYARGKVGDLVFSRSNGKQITRARASQVRNPQTESQMIQRIILNTVAQAYSKFINITDHSFEGVNGAQKSMSYFMRRNIDNLRTRLQNDIAEGYDLGSIYAFTPIGSNEYSANEYIMSKGTLPEIVAGFATGNVAKFALSANTYQAVLSDYGLQRGDQLTLIVTQGTSGANTSFYYARVILDPTNADGTAASLDSPLIADGAINLPNPRNEGTFNTLAFDATVGVKYNFSNQVVSGACVIVSRKNTDGSWLRSNATLAQNVSAVAGWQKSMQECLDLFTSGGIDTLNSRYLNNAGSGRLASSGGFTLTNVFGQQVQITGFALVTNPNPDQYAPNIVELTGANGQKYYIKDVNTASRALGMWLTSLTGYQTQAWQGQVAPTTDGNNIIGITGIDTDNVRTLVANGIPLSVFVYDDGGTDVASVDSVTYHTSEDSTERPWPAAGSTTIVDVSSSGTLTITINGGNMTANNPAVKRGSTAQSTTGTATQRTLTANQTDLYTIEVNAVLFGGGVQFNLEP